MKLLVLGDSHGQSRLLRKVLAKEGEHVAACFHLGDGMRDIDAMIEACPALPLYAVRGNCDFGSGPSEGLVPFGRLLIYYTHGHQLGVKQGMYKLWQQANRQGADIALYGHTHVARYNCQNGLHLFCPGSIAAPRFGPSSYGIITIQGGMPSFSICPLP